MNPLFNTIEILKPGIPLTDLSDDGYVRYYPGGVAKPCMEILKNGSRLLDDNFWLWQMTKQCEFPAFTFEGSTSPFSL